MDLGTHGLSPKGKLCSRKMCPFPGQHGSWNWLRKHRLVAYARPVAPSPKGSCFILEGLLGCLDVHVLREQTNLGLGWAARNSTGHHLRASQQTWDLAEIGQVGPRLGGLLTDWKNQEASAWLSFFICQHGVGGGEEGQAVRPQTRRHCPSQSLASLSFG